MYGPEERVEGVGEEGREAEKRYSSIKIIKNIIESKCLEQANKQAKKEIFVVNWNK